MKVQLKLPEAFDINSQTINVALFLVSLGFEAMFWVETFKKSQVKNCHEALNIRLKWKLSVPVAKPEFNLHTCSTVHFTFNQSQPIMFFLFLQLG